MEIRTVEIKNLMGGFLAEDYEGVRHVKSMPCLSVVQSVHGTYEIGLGGAPLQQTEQGGAFFAPSGVIQEIVHHNGSRGIMEAHWAIFNIMVNGLFDFEDLFVPPLLIPASYGEVLYNHILTIRFDTSLCRRYAAAYGIADLLLSLSSPRDTVIDEAALLARRYVDEHYGERITKEELAAAAHCSVAGLYRLFRRCFHLSPNNYINKYRLGKASVLLESSDQAVSEIAESVGFDDPVYFSKLFKECYGITPGKYRKNFLSGHGTEAEAGTEKNTEERGGK